WCWCGRSSTGRSTYETALASPDLGPGPPDDAGSGGGLGLPLLLLGLAARADGVLRHDDSPVALADRHDRGRGRVGSPRGSWPLGRGVRRQRPGALTARRLDGVGFFPRVCPETPKGRR